MQTYTIKGVDSNIAGAIVGSNGRTIKDITSKYNTYISLKKQDDNTLNIVLTSTNIENILFSTISIKKIIESITYKKKYNNVYKTCIKNIKKELYGYLVGKDGSFTKWIKSSKAKDNENHNIQLIGYSVNCENDSGIELRLISQYENNLKWAKKYIYNRINNIKKLNC
tara:strand:+ start:1271 stop:1774 length:504 start_codon:yes stop_codon:yes gene_type:complete